MFPTVYQGTPPDDPIQLPSAQRYREEKSRASSAHHVSCEFQSASPRRNLDLSSGGMFASFPFVLSVVYKDHPFTELT